MPAFGAKSVFFFAAYTAGEPVGEKDEGRQQQGNERQQPIQQGKQAIQCIGIILGGNHYTYDTKSDDHGIDAPAVHAEPKGNGHDKGNQ